MFLLTKIVHSGDAFVNLGYLSNSGASGYYWSSRSESIDGSAYFLSVSTAKISPTSGKSARWFGFSLRCLAGMKKRGGIKIHSRLPCTIIYSNRVRYEYGWFVDVKSVSTNPLTPWALPGMNVTLITSR